MICAKQAPDHATIARFRVRRHEALADLSSQVLDLCAEAGLAEVAALAADGSKFEASASNHASRSYEQIAKGSSRRRARSTPPRASSTAMRHPVQQDPDNHLAGLHVRASMIWLKDLTRAGG